MDTVTAHITTAPQGSTEWLMERVGHFTSSEIYRLLTLATRKMTDEEKAEAKANKSKRTTIEDESILSSGAMTYVLEKVDETMTGISKDFLNEATYWGIEQEPLARKWYEQRNNVQVDLLGFARAADSYGGSVDGKVGATGIIEIKCPFKGENHLQHLLISSQEKFKENHKDYYFQCQSNMFIMGAEWCDFISFNPRLNYDSGYFQFRVYRNEDDIDLISKKVARAVEMKYELLKEFTK